MKRPGQVTPTPSRALKGAKEGPERDQTRVSGFTGTDSSVSSADSGLAGGPPVGTQQINLDWSRFENHTFFDSAAGKVNASFLRVINEYPFDGTKDELRDFNSSLSGFDKYIFDRFPKSTGSLEADGNCYIEALDQTGAAFPDQSRDTLGREVIAPNGKDFSIQAHLRPDDAINRVQVVTQYRRDEKNAFTLFLSHSETTTDTKVVFAVSSGSLSLATSAPVSKGTYQHITARYNAGSSTSSLEILVDAALAATSSGVITLGDDFRAPMLTLCSGSSFFEGNKRHVPDQLYVGGIDDFRIYHERRGAEKLAADMQLGGNAEPTLVVYYKFNEPTGSHAQASVVLDSSGNSLHTRISQYTSAVRSTTSAVVGERLYDNPVLFPDFSETASLNADLVTSGSEYDEENPNFILRLVPPHYFGEGQARSGLTTIQGDLTSPIQGNSIPGSGDLGSLQILSSLLLMYAKSFDEIKVFHDHFSRLTYVDYDENASVSDSFLGFLAKYYGFDLPNLFPVATIEQYLQGSGVSATETVPLRRIQDVIFRRILTNMRDIVTAKGTHASIKALLNAAGIAPNSFFRIREYGGPTETRIEGIREDVTEVTSMLYFTGSLASTAGTLTTDGFDTRKPRIVGSFLSASRVEPGFPQIGGQFVNGVSNSVNDGLLTSGSWTIEGQFKVASSTRPQSVMRIHTTGSSAYASVGGVLLNVVAEEEGVTAFFSCDAAGSSPLRLHLSGTTVLDGNRWHISFSRRRADDDRPLSSSINDRERVYTRSQYTLTCQRPEGLTFITSSFFDDASAVSNNALETVSSTFNASGAFVVVGSQSLAVGAGYSFLNQTGIDQLAQTTNFSGRLAHLRFWSKCLDESEIREHARSHRSLGVRDPRVNFGFVNTTSGSFEKLRMDLSCDQPVTGASGLGEIQIFDFSQQRLHAAGKGFEPSALVLRPDTTSFSQISTRFDVRQTSDKVRVRSYQEADNLIGEPGSLPAPLYEQVRSETPIADPRIAVEASAVDALNDDLIKLVSSLDFFDAALGDPRVMFDDYYPDLEALRRVYFNRLTDRPDLKAMYEVFNWVSRALGDLIGQLIPMNSVYLGVSYVVESHVAERARVRYFFDRQYVSSTATERISLVTGTDLIDARDTARSASGDLTEKKRSKR